MLRKINLVYRSVALHKVSPLCTALTQQPRQQHLSSDLSLCSQNHAFASAVLQDAINSEKNRSDNSEIVNLFQRAQAHNNHRLTFQLRYNFCIKKDDKYVEFQPLPVSQSNFKKIIDENYFFIDRTDVLMKMHKLKI